ncbi:Hypothetical protein A7982_11039 [Minicystis rosea]|nr:Hypothetical protein A7982_11039 [Minicystis rosea]
MLLAMSDFDPFALAARQIALDRAATAGIPELFARKRARLAPSPHAFLRGSAPLFYEILARRPDLAGGPAGDGWLVGDMHLENVGAYRTDEDEVVFGINDFDDGTIGPLRYDVLRLSTSVILAGRGFRATAAQSIRLVEHLVSAYLSARAGGDAPDTPAIVAELVEKVEFRNQQDLLDARAPKDAHGKRHFLRPERYLDLPPEVETGVPLLLGAYLTALGNRAPAKSTTWKIEDAAQRVAGNGSLGVQRIAVLVRERDGDERIVELKECRTPSSNVLFTPPAGRFSHPGERVVMAARALLVAPPRLLAGFQAEGLSFAGRRLFPQEDKLNLDTLHTGSTLDGLVRQIGYILGAAHARGLAALGTTPVPKLWTGPEIGAVIDHAVEMAGLLEGVYLTWARRIV